MKIKVKLSEFQTAVDQAAFFINPSSPAPSLRCLYFYLSGNDLLIQAVDPGAETVTRKVFAIVADNMIRAFDMCPIELSKYLKKIKTPEIELTVTPDQVVISYGNNRFTIARPTMSDEYITETRTLLNGLDPAEPIVGLNYHGMFLNTEGRAAKYKTADPNYTAYGPGHGFKFTMTADVKHMNGIGCRDLTELYYKIYQNLLKLTSPDPVKPAYTGLNVRGIGGSMAVEATDGKRAARVTFKAITFEYPGSIIIPRAIVEFMLKFKIASMNVAVLEYASKPDKKKPAESMIRDVVFMTPEIEIVAPVIDGKFPDIDAVLPKMEKAAVTMTGSKACWAEFIGAFMDRMDPDDVDAIHFKIDSDGSEASTKSKTVTQIVAIPLAVELKAAAGLSATFGKILLSEVIALAGGDKFTVGFAGNTAPMFYTYDAGGHTVDACLMPIMTRKY